MEKIPSSKIRDNFADIVGRVAYGHERLVLERNGKPLLALIPLNDLSKLERCEEELKSIAGDAATG